MLNCVDGIIGKYHIPRGRFPNVMTSYPCIILLASPRMEPIVNVSGKPSPLTILFDPDLDNQRTDKPLRV